MPNDDVSKPSGSKSRTRVAVLGALSVEPMTGYEIHQGIAASIGHFWSESYGQIYPVLKDLESAGLVTADPSATGRGRTFTITDEGLAELKELLRDLGAAPPPRNTLLLQLFFGRHLGADWCRDRIADARREAEAQLALFETITAELEAESGYEEHRAYWLSTVSFGRTVAAAIIDWADEAAPTLPAE